MKTTQIDYQKLHQLAYNSLLELTTDDGIFASARNEVYGCLFGRDSFITIIKTLDAFKRLPKDRQVDFHPLLEKFKTTILLIASEQGKKINLENGEEPGKFIHELRTSGYEHLLNAEKPWFVDEQGILKIFDSIDSTPLGLIAIYKYWEATQDGKFIIEMLPVIEAGLNWIITYGDWDKDGLIEYNNPLETRKHGGLVVHSWTDSHESFTDTSGLLPKYPIAPVEVQSFAWLALKLWAKFYANSHASKDFSVKLTSFADSIKQKFNEKFILQDEDLFYGAQALDGNKNQIKTITGNPLLCLWTVFEENDKKESIINDIFIEQFVKRAFLPDMFIPHAGIRTMSSNSPTFNPKSDSYHNGSFWPMLNGLIVRGLENFNFKEEASLLKKASLLPIVHFGSPIELYNLDENNQYIEYCSPSGHFGCKQQAWSAAAVLYLTADELIDEPTCKNPQILLN